MSRSASDATRFTATAPHVYSRASTVRPHPAHSQTPSPSNNASHTLPRPGPLPPNQNGGSQAAETPAQKVARLRAAHAAKRASEISSWDRIVVRSRMVADSAHRITVMGLIGLTVIAGGITVFSLGDMILYNRRKRKLFYQEQHLMRKQRLIDAMAAEAAGTADEDQTLLLNQERTAIAFGEEKKRKKGWWKGLKGVFGLEGMRKEDIGGEGAVQAFDKEADVLTSTARSGEVVGSGLVAEDTAPGAQFQNGSAAKSNILRAVEDQRRAGEKGLLSRGAEGGQLDKLGEEATTAVSTSNPAQQSSRSSWWGRS